MRHCSKYYEVPRFQMPCFFREDIHGSLPQVILVMMCSLCLLLSCSLSLPDVSESGTFLTQRMSGLTSQSVRVASAGQGSSTKASHSSLLSLGIAGSSQLSTPGPTNLIMRPRGSKVTNGRGFPLRRHQVFWVLQDFRKVEKRASSQLAISSIPHLVPSIYQEAKEQFISTVFTPSPSPSTTLILDILEP